MIARPCGSYRLAFFNATENPVKVEFYQKIDYRTETEGKRWTKEIKHGPSKVFRIPMIGSARYSIDVTYFNGTILKEDLDYEIPFNSFVKYTFIEEDRISLVDWELVEENIVDSSLLSKPFIKNLFYLLTDTASCIENEFFIGYSY